MGVSGIIRTQTPIFYCFVFFLKVPNKLLNLLLGPPLPLFTFSLFESFFFLISDKITSLLTNFALREVASNYKHKENMLSSVKSSKL